MNTTKIKTEKRTYIQPKVEVIVIDTEISLQFTSPGGNAPEDQILTSNDYFKNDPFKTNIG